MNDPLAGISLALLLAASAAAQCQSEWSPGFGRDGVDYPVRALVTWDPDGAGPQQPVLVAGGEFLSAGEAIVHKVAVWQSNGQWSPLGGGLVSGGSTWVSALAVAQNGDLLAAVYSYNGSTTLGSLKRWNGATWSTVAPSLNHRIEALTVMPNGDIVAAGGFTAAGAVAANYIARWDGAQWHAMGSGMDYWINALQTLQNGDLVATGGFTVAGGVAANRIARWNGTAWSPLGTGLDNWGSALATLPGGDLVVGGIFTTAGGVPASNIARWDGTGWSPLGSGVDAAVYALDVLPDGDLVAVGTFTTAGGSPNEGAARWDGSTWTAVGSSPAPQYGWSSVVALPGGDLVLGRIWLSTAYIARWDGSNWDLMGAGQNGLTGAADAVRASLELPSGDVVVGGDFDRIRGQLANGIAVWDGASFAPLGTGMTSTGPLGPKPGSVRAVARLPNGDLVAGGAFDTAGGVTAYNIARWNGSSWSPMGVGMNDTVLDLAVLPGGDLVAGGKFVFAGGVAANFVARWDGTAWHPLGSGLVGAGYPVAEALGVLPGGDLAVGGSFHTAGAVPANNLARWDGSSWHAMGAGTTSTVKALTLRADGRLLAASETTGSGPPIWQWDGTSLLQITTAPSTFVFALAELPGGDLAAGGRNFGLPSWTYLTRWNGATWSQLGPGSTWTDQTGIQTLRVLGDGRLMVGGHFTNNSSVHSENLALLLPGCPASATVLPTNCVGPTGPLTLTADNLPWLGTTCRTTASGFVPGSIAVGLFGLTSPNVPWTWLSPVALPGCEQLSSQEAILFLFPSGPTQGMELEIANNPAFVGLVVYHQFLHFALSAQGHLSSLSSSNGLALTIGLF